MSTLTPEEITGQITEMGDKIKQAKADKQPKELWDEYLQNMLKLKVSCMCMCMCMFVCCVYCMVFVLSIFAILSVWKGQ